MVCPLFTQQWSWVLVNFGTDAVFETTSEITEKVTQNENPREFMSGWGLLNIKTVHLARINEAMGRCECQWCICNGV